MSSAVATSGAGDARRPGRPDSPAALVAASGVPAPLADLVLAVTGTCRLWTSERVDVARELCAHFLDGLDAGTPAADLARDFGDPAAAARLITAARKRLRPRWWHLARGAGRAAAACLALLLLAYAILAARYFVPAPNIARNIAAELNAPILATPASDRAWPLYIEAKRLLGPIPEFIDQAPADRLIANDPRLPQYAAWLDAHAPAFSALRTAAAKPIIGAPLRSSPDPDLDEVMKVTNPRFVPGPLQPEPKNPFVVGLLLPHLGELRRSARWLHTDALVAAAAGDRERFLADVNAMLGMTRQSLRESSLIGQLVGIAIGEFTTRLILTHIDQTDLFTDTDLRNLAHTLAAVGRDSRLSLDTSYETLMFEDILQRFFSDDGRGDGHFIGAPDNERLRAEFGLPRTDTHALSVALQPVQCAIMPSRAHLARKVHDLAAAVARDEALPPWRHDERTADATYTDVVESLVARTLPSLLRLFSEQGPFASAFASRDLFRARRDAALAVIALESFRRARGDWPASLDELVPTYLPALPVDPFDGRPLRYLPPASPAARPVLYSVGADGVDDHARTPDNDAGRAGVRNFRWIAAFRVQSGAPTPSAPHTLDTFRGDWVIYPEPPPIPAAR